MKYRISYYIYLEYVYSIPNFITPARFIRVIGPILVCENKVHFLYSYEREDEFGNVMSQHHHIWILTLEEGKWGIQVRWTVGYDKQRFLVK